jgi:sugar phosphate isomerase/epimerase
LNPRDQPNFGFKIVERSRSEVEPIVERALQDHRPVEVGLYFGDEATRSYLADRLPGSGLPVAVHLDHRRLSVLGAEHREPELREQLRLAARLGARYVITHLGPHPMTARAASRQRMLDGLFTGLRSIERLAGEYGLRVHLENTYHDLPFYRDFFQAVRSEGMALINGCFDIGHAKVWSDESLREWLDFLANLQEQGLTLHFHLHANRGLRDEHLSFLAAEQLGIAGGDAYTDGLSYYQALAAIAERFPRSPKVFEVPAQEALANLDHVLARIGDIG